MTQPVPARRSLAWDVVLALALGLAASSFAARAMTLIGPGIGAEFAEDSWFQSDAAQIAGEMSDRRAAHARGSVHPIFTLLTTPPVLVFKNAFGWPPERATGAVIIGIAGLWGATLYALLRSLRCRRPDAVLYALLGIASAAAMFWLPIRDRYALGSVSIMAALALIATAANRAGARTTVRWIIASASALAITVTNWMFAILAAAVLLPLRRALLVTAGGGAVIVGCWLLQSHFVPREAFFVPTGEEKQYIYRPTPDRIGGVLRVAALYSMVAPHFERLHEGGNPLPLDAELRPPAPNQLTMQAVPIGSTDTAGKVALVAWLAALGLGVVAAFRRWRDQPIWLVILLGLAGQVALHAVYGEETFLYVLHWLPLLVAVAAAATLGRFRPASLSLAAVVLTGATVNNAAALRRAARLYGPEREIALKQKRHRPDDPWPRGEGHVVLAQPGTPEAAKTWLEPGASLSPVKGSFGLSLWVKDSLGRLLTTGDRIPLAEVRQRFVWDSGARIPAIATETASYRARWQLAGPGRWQLTVEPVPTTGSVELVLRSVGPSGGPVRSLHWDGARLRINDAWSLTLAPAPRGVVIGQEGDTPWVTAKPGVTAWTGEEGWGFARLELAREGATVATLTADSVIPDHSPLPAELAPFPEISLPDPRFAESVRAEIAQLAMSLVRGETRSADPVNTPIPWQRTGAYIITALARAGQVPLAQSLSVFLAENDYYGGFGAEADAPGLGIWGLTEVGAQVADSGFDRWAWPHVRRKAERILALLDAREDVRESPSFPITPWTYRNADAALVANPAKDGLIVGRMDFGRPLLFVNALSYGGLVRAADLASRLGHRDDAAQFRARAQQLRAAWTAALREPELENPRSYIAALWPSGVADEPKARDAFQAAFDEWWTHARDSIGQPRERPLWTYFDLAEAHQWLLLGRPDRAWQVMQWFWEHQASPGLYTWWEGDDEGNTFGWWSFTRGWLAPETVTPHYWTTAEMLLLQLDMLARVDRDGTEPELVIGDGLPSGWLAQPLSVRGLRVAGRTIDWSWRAGRLEVSVRGAPIRVRAGAPFPRATRLLSSVK